MQLFFLTLSHNVPNAQTGIWHYFSILQYKKKRRVNPAQGCPLVAKHILTQTAEHQRPEKKAGGGSGEQTSQWGNLCADLSTDPYPLQAQRLKHMGQTWLVSRQKKKSTLVALGRNC